MVRLLTGPQMEARLRLYRAEIALLRDRLAVVEREEARRLNGNRPRMLTGRVVAKVLGMLRKEA